MHVVAAKAVCFLEAMTPEFVEYQKQVVANASALAAGLAEAGFRVVSGGTDTHLLLVDVFAKGIGGKEAETALDEACITANKNAIPFDTNPPMNPSGIRLGSPAVTTRGFGEPKCARWRPHRRSTLSAVDAPENLAAVRARVKVLTDKFPLYAWKLSAAVA